MVEKFINFYNNGIYYPNIFFIFILFLFLLAALLILLSLLLIRDFPRWSPFLKNKEKEFKKYVKKNYVIIMIVILIAIIFSRYIVTFSRTYSDDINVASPIASFQLPFATDFRTCVIRSIQSILEGGSLKFEYGPTTACGQAIPMLLIPFVLIFRPEGAELVYYWIFSTSILYFIFLYLLTRREKPESKYVIYLFVISFVMGIPGNLGIFVSNVDVFLSFLIGVILLLLYGEKSKKRVFRWGGVLLSLLIGAVAGFTANAKIFLSPLALISVLFSSKKIIAFAGLLITFFGIIYLPSIIFGSPTSISSYLERIIEWKESIGGIYSNVEGNHSIPATATFFSKCIENQNCKTNSLQKFVSNFILAIFIISVLPISFLKRLVNNKEKLKRKILKLSKNLNTLNFMLLLFIITLAIINLIPEVSYNYRLFYSIPVLLILWIKTKEIPKSRYYCFLAMVALLLKGLWIAKIGPTESGIVGLIDPRIMNIFIVLHFIFFIKSGTENLSSRVNLLKV